MPALLPVLRLLRVGTLFSPAADVTASLCVLGLPWNGTAAGAVAAGVLLYAAGMVWNDIADRRLDAVQRPERPLPRGDVSLAFAVGLGTALLATALAVSPCRGYHALLAALILVYDFGSKRLGWVSAPLMGTLRAMNLGTALWLPGVFAGARTDALAVACLCYGIYILAVTVLGIFEDEPRVRPRAVAAVQVAPPLVALAGIAAVQHGMWPATTVALLPALWFLRRNARQRAWSQATIRGAMRHLLLGTMLYTALLAFAAERPWEALAIGTAIVPARWIARRISLT